MDILTDNAAKSLFVIAVILAVGCGDQVQSKTTAERPEQSRDVISDADVEALERAGATVYTGLDAPPVDGTYLMDDLVHIHDDTGEHDANYTIVDYYYTFEPTGEDHELEISLHAPEVDHLVDGLGGYVSGSGDCFTAYAETRTESSGDEDCSYTYGELFSGCVTEGGIEQFENGYIVTSADGDDCHEEGTRRVIADDFGPKQ